MQEWKIIEGMGGIAANPTPLIVVNNTKTPCLHLKRKSLMLIVEAIQEGKRVLSILIFFNFFI